MNVYRYGLDIWINANGKMSQFHLKCLAQSSSSVWPLNYKAINLNRYGGLSFSSKVYHETRPGDRKIFSKMTIWTKVDFQDTKGHARSLWNVLTFSLFDHNASVEHLVKESPKSWPCLWSRPVVGDKTEDLHRAEASPVKLHLPLRIS